MITAHPLIQVHLIAPQLLLWIALPHHGDIMLATNYLFCRCYSVPFGQHAVETEDKVRLNDDKMHPRVLRDLGFLYCTRPCPECTSPRNRKLLSRQRPNQKDRTWSMIDYESCDMSDRFRPNCVSTTVFGARTNNHQVCLPFGCSVNNFALWSALPLDRLCAGEATQPFIQDILGRQFLGLPHLFLSWRRW